eukprot:SAG31_NODE_7140_length_1779_cov_0.745238_3_plen_50_part_00
MGSCTAAVSEHVILCPGTDPGALSPEADSRPPPLETYAPVPPSDTHRLV